MEMRAELKCDDPPAVPSYPMSEMLVGSWAVIVASGPGFDVDLIGMLVTRLFSTESLNDNMFRVFTPDRRRQIPGDDYRVRDFKDGEYVVLRKV